MSENTLTPDRDFHVRQAVSRSIGPTAAIEGPKPGMQYSGTAILVNDKYLVQQIGDKAVAHRREALGDLPLDDEDAKRPYKLHGSPLSVRYDDTGRGAVQYDFDQLRRNSERMDKIEADYRQTFTEQPKPAQQPKANPLRAFVGAANARHATEQASRSAPAPTATGGPDYEL